MPKLTKWPPRLHFAKASHVTCMLTGGERRCPNGCAYCVNLHHGYIPCIQLSEQILVSQTSLNILFVSIKGVYKICAYTTQIGCCILILHPHHVISESGNLLELYRRLFFPSLTETCLGRGLLMILYLNKNRQYSEDFLLE